MSTAVTDKLHPLLKMQKKLPKLPLILSGVFEKKKERVLMLAVK